MVSRQVLATPDFVLLTLRKCTEQVTPMGRVALLPLITDRAMVMVMR